MHPYKVLITSLTMAAAATALSCTAATAQEGAVTIRSSDSLTREQTQALVLNYIVHGGAAPVAEAEEGIGSGQNVPEAEVATEREDAAGPVQDETPDAPVAESHEPEVVQTEVVLAPSPEPSTPPAAEPEPSSDADVAITPEPEPSTPAPEPSGESEVPITPEPEPVRSERDEVPAEQRPTDDVVPVIEPEPEPSTPPAAEPEPSSDADVAITPEPEPSSTARASEGAQDSGGVNQEVPIAPSSDRGSSPAVQDSGEVAGNGEVEVVIAPEAPAPVKPSTQQPKNSTVQKQDEKVSPSAIPAQGSGAEKRRELAYTGVDSGGLAIGGFVLIATGAAGVFAVRRRVAP